MATLSRTVEQRTNLSGFPKPGELIEMTGTHVLEASDRAILNLLYQNAHDSGRLLEENAEWEIPLATLRQAFSKHASSDRLRDSLNRLMTVKVNVAYVAMSGGGAEGPEQRVVITGLFDFFDVMTCFNCDVKAIPWRRGGFWRTIAGMQRFTTSDMQD